MPRPNPLKTAWVLGVAVAACACVAVLLWGCSGCSSALPDPVRAQALVMCQLDALRPLEEARQRAKALPETEAHETLARAALIAVGHLRACVSPDDAGAT